MGFFSEIASEARRSGRSSTPPQPAAPEQLEQHVPSPEAPPEPAPAAPEPKPVPEQPSAASAHTPPPPETKLAVAKDAASPPDDTAARQAHEAAEAKRKAEWEAKQAEKKAAEQAALDEVAAMSDEDAISEAARRVADATEKITRRNMKDQVAAHIQALCRRDPAFARKIMRPRKSMIRCFRYIGRRAFEYIKDEMEANGIEPGPGAEGYGCDVADDLCFQWAVAYFNDPNAKEDQRDKDEEKFVPKPYVPVTPASRKKTQGKTDKKPPRPKGAADAGQITLGGFATTEVKAG